VQQGRKGTRKSFGTLFHRTISKNSLKKYPRVFSRSGLWREIIGEPCSGNEAD